MPRYLTLLAVVALGFNTAMAAAPIEAPPESKGMKTIFNGKDLSGWDGDPRLWSVKNGTIHGETTAKTKANGNTFIIWKRWPDQGLRTATLVPLQRDKQFGNPQYRSKHIKNKVRNKWGRPGLPARDPQ